jgi:hypothetical protein
VQVAVDHAGREPRDRADVRAQDFQPRLLRQDLRNRDDGAQHHGSGQADDPERAKGETVSFGHAHIFAQSRQGPHSKTTAALSFLIARVLLLRPSQSIDNAAS